MITITMPASLAWLLLFIGALELILVGLRSWQLILLKRLNKMLVEKGEKPLEIS